MSLARKLVMFRNRNKSIAFKSIVDGVAFVRVEVILEELIRHYS